MPIFATAGAKLHIGGALSNAVVVASDFTSQTWVEVRNLESIGSFGDTAEVIDATTIDHARKFKLKGARDAGTMEVTAFLDYADAGQLALLAAEATPHGYAFRVTFNDAPPGGTPSQRLFVAMVTGASEQLDGANDAMKMQATLAINSNIVRVAAAAA